MKIRITRAVIPYVIIVLGGFLTTAVVAAVPCAEGGPASFTDVAYCQLANQLNKPARWVDGIFAEKGQTSRGKMNATVVLGTNIYPDSTFDTFTAVRARIYLPNLEDKFRFQFTSSQNISSATSTSSAPSSTTGARSAVSAIFSPKLGSAQLGIGWSQLNNVVILAQASLPIKQTYGKNQLGLIPRVLWNRDDGTTWVAQLYWDHNFSTNNKFRDNLLKEPLNIQQQVATQQGCVTIPDGPGLGVEPDQDFIAHYSTG